VTLLPSWKEFLERWRQMKLVRACAIARRTPNPTISLNYFFFPSDFAKKTWKIHSYIPSDNVL
jgi:hypothetical protein